MPKWAKTIVAILLLPLCWGAARALARVVAASGQADTVWVALLGGAACWWAIYLILPKPMWIYVFGHELTHAISTWLCGGSVQRFKVTPEGGHVVVSKTNFLIALAPYFVPLYAIIVLFVFWAGNSLWAWRVQSVWFHLLVGAAYGFHLTLTWSILQTRQTDITSQGYIFSAVVIFLGNVLVLLLAVPLLTKRVALLTAFSWWIADSVTGFAWIANAVIDLKRGAGEARQ
jgi:Peptidase M50B-like